MNVFEMDDYYAAMTIIEILYELGAINHKTYSNIKRHTK